MSQSPYETETEHRHRPRREAQRKRRRNLDDHEQGLQWKRNTSARAENRARLDEAQQAEIRQHNSQAHRLRRNTLSASQRDAVRQTDRNAHQTRRSAPSAPDNRWWERVAVLNESQTSKTPSLRWNRNAVPVIRWATAGALSRQSPLTGFDAESFMLLPICKKQPKECLVKVQMSMNNVHQVQENCPPVPSAQPNSCSVDSSTSSHWARKFITVVLLFVSLNKQTGESQ
ncbi:hypothetical protein B0H13DRAFT_1876865 [Mycena leptocephala]|nr:hypothetical protein B0H13DRAFT_1876865 [Mycena leptocephala]